MRESVDITVIGGGIAGLWTAKSFCDEGLRVCIIESDKELAAGATTRNEGWLHAGTYASASIDSEVDAKMVAYSSRVGFDEIIRFADDCLDHRISYALLGNNSAAQRARARWIESNIKHVAVKKELIARDNINTAHVEAAFMVEDHSINTHKLCTKLVHYLQRKGVIILTDTKFKRYDDSTLLLQIANNRTSILTSNLFIITSGCGTSSAAHSLTGGDIPMQYFKSHLKIIRRQTENNYFFVDGGETGFMNHGAYSIAGLNRDSVPLLQPDYSPIGEKTTLLDEALSRLLMNIRSHDDDKHIACIKPSFQADKDNPHLGEDIIKLSTNCYAALPGKMTQAPHMTNILKAELLGATTLTLSTPANAGVQAHPVLHTPRVKLRPLDTLS